MAACGNRRRSFQAYEGHVRLLWKISAVTALEIPSLAPDENKFSPVGSLGNITKKLYFIWQSIMYVQESAAVHPRIRESVKHKIAVCFNRIWRYAIVRMEAMDRAYLLKSISPSNKMARMNRDGCNTLLRRSIA